MRRKNRGAGGEKKGKKKRKNRFAQILRRVAQLWCISFVLIGPRRVPATRPGRVAAQERVADAQGNRDIAFSLWCVPRSLSPALSRALRSRAFLPRTSIGRRRRRHFLLATVAPGSSVERFPFRFL
jgi:hypothetical protein